jgi:hypothetical protein
MITISTSFTSPISARSNRLAVREIHLKSRCQNLFPHAYVFVRATTLGQILPFQKFKRRASATRKECHLVAQAKPANCPGNSG